MPYKYSIRIEDLLWKLLEAVSGETALQVGVDDDGFFFVTLPKQLTSAQLSKLKDVFANVKEEMR